MIKAKTAIIIRLEPAMIKRLDACIPLAQKWHKDEFPWFGTIPFSRADIVRSLLARGLAQVEAKA